MYLEVSQGHVSDQEGRITLLGETGQLEAAVRGSAVRVGPVLMTLYLSAQSNNIRPQTQISMAS